MPTPTPIDFWARLLARLGVDPGVADDWADTFARVMDTRPFSSDHDLPHFLGQVLHESSMLTRLQENLNYSTQRLMQVWPRRFPTLASAQPFARNPQALANRVYGRRLGNTDPDDGWRYRGRGLIQLTGRDNYACIEQATGLPLLDEPDILLEQQPALVASVAWWELNVPDSALSDVAHVTRIVNGGHIGLQHRAKLTQMAYQMLEQV